MTRLTVDEQERIAYASGNTERAALLANCCDVDKLIEDQGDEIVKHGEAEYSRGYKDGEAESADSFSVERIESLTSELQRVNDTLRSVATAIKRVEIELVGDGCKTVTGRRSIARALRTMRLTSGLH